MDNRVSEILAFLLGLAVVFTIVMSIIILIMEDTDTHIFNATSETRIYASAYTIMTILGTGIMLVIGSIGWSYYKQKQS